MEIKNEFNNALLGRREVLVSHEFDANPGFDAVTKMLAEKFKADGENVIVKNIKNNYGSREFLIEALIYASQEHRNKFERKTKEKKAAGGAQ
jgi:ribosomal protein S24E